MIEWKQQVQKLRAVSGHVPLSCQRCSCAQRASCCACSRAPYALVPDAPGALHALVPCGLPILRALVLYFCRFLCALLSHMLRALCLLVSPCLVPSVFSCFMSPFSLHTLFVPCTLNTLCANITFCALEFPCHTLLFFYSFSTCEFSLGNFLLNIAYIVSR